MHERQSNDCSLHSGINDSLPLITRNLQNFLGSGQGLCWNNPLTPRQNLVGLGRAGEEGQALLLQLSAAAAAAQAL